MQSRYDKYISSPVKYTDDKLISEHVSYPVMGQHETLIMKESANVVCQNGGKILNVGFGMGIIDSFIRDHNPQEHHIVDVHPDVIKKAKEMGFDKTAVLYESDWRDLISTWNQQDIKFDGIYFDTIVLDHENRPEWDDFARVVDSILAEGGVFSFFNNIATMNSKEMWNKLRSLKYKEYHKVISLDKIIKEANHTEDMKFLRKKDYQLVWYVK